MKKLILIVGLMIMSVYSFGQELKEFTRYYNHVAEFSYDEDNSVWVKVDSYDEVNKITFNINGTTDAKITTRENVKPFYMYGVYSAPDNEQTGKVRKFYYTTAYGELFVGFLGDKHCTVTVNNSAWRFEQ